MKDDSTRKYTSLITAILFNNYKTAKFLIKSGANVNNCCSFEGDNGIERLLSPLSVVEYIEPNEAQAKIAKLLVKKGAQKNFFFSFIGAHILRNAALNHRNCNLLRFKERSIVEEKLGNESVKYLEKEKALDSIRKIHFYSGKFDESSLICSLPKEILGKIMTCNDNINHVKEKAQKMINNAVNIICQNEILFLCASVDSTSGMFWLPKEIIKFVLNIRINLDKN